MMRRALLLALLLLAARPAAAELWCGSGPGAPLDHPCADDNSRFTRAFADHGRQMAEWRKIPGVKSIGYGISHRGYFPEIQVWVKDAATVPLVRPKVPCSIDQIAVVVVPPLRVTIGEPQGPLNCPEDNTGGRYIRALKKIMTYTTHMPGVVGVGPANCEHGCCHYDRVGVGVQVPFLESVRAKVPREVYAIPIEVIPYPWPPPSERFPAPSLK